MSPTRRDLMKIAAGLGLTGIVPTLDQRTTAAKALNHRLSDNLFLDPATFANEMDRTIGTAFEDDWFSMVCPKEHVAERRAYQALGQAYPELVRGGITPLSNYQEAVYSLGIHLYVVGLRHGAAYENLRRSVVGEVRSCDGCYGAGITYDDDHCTSCGGTGIVALKA